MPERPVPPHDHSSFSRGGKLTTISLSGFIGDGGSSSGGSSGGSSSGDHDHTAYVTVVDGGKETLSTIAATGATETVDLADGNVHDLTLDDDCTFTFTGSTASVACSFTLVLRQDGTGGWLVTWPGSVIWPGGVTPTLSTDPDAVDVFTFFTIDNGTVWFGFQAGAGTSVGGLDDLSDVTITSPEEGSRLRYNGSVWVDSMSFPEILISDTPSTPLVFADLIQNEAQDDLLYGDP